MGVCPEQVHNYVLYCAIKIIILLPFSVFGILLADNCLIETMHDG